MTKDDELYIELIVLELKFQFDGNKWSELICALAKHLLLFLGME